MFIVIIVVGWKCVEISFLLLESLKETRRSWTHDSIHSLSHSPELCYLFCPVKEKEDAHTDPEFQPMKDDDCTFGEYR